MYSICIFFLFCYLTSSINSSSSSSLLRNGDDLKSVIELARSLSSNLSGDLQSRAIKAAHNYTSHLARINNGNKLLCAVFMNISGASLQNLNKNIEIAGNLCNWAILGYGGDNDPQQRNLLNKSMHFYGSNLVYYRQEDSKSLYKSYISARNLNLKYTSLHYTYQFNGTKTGQSYNFEHIPKPLLYMRLLPYLLDFDRIWLLDEDISFSNFDFKTFFNIIDCGIPIRTPLIAQALVAENSQFFKYLNAISWKGSHVIAVPTGYIEQQAPIVDAAFFHWFVTYIISPLLPAVFVLGSDWSFDDTWCRASSYFASINYGYPNHFPMSCMLVIGGTPIHHINLRSLQFMYLDMHYFGRVGVVMRNITATAFPAWFNEGFRSNPLNPKEKNARSKGVWKLPHNNCVSKYSSKLP